MRSSSGRPEFPLGVQDVADLLERNPRDFSDLRDADPTAARTLKLQAPRLREPGLDAVMYPLSRSEALELASNPLAPHHVEVYR